MTEEIKRAIQDIVNEEYGRISNNIDGQLIYEMDVDYRDEMDPKTACEILESDDPMQTFEEMLDEGFRETQWTYEDELFDKIVEHLVSAFEPFPDELTADDNVIRECMNDYIYFDVPRNHFLDQKFCVNIMMDTGDGNYDYVLNSVYPCWYGDSKEFHNDKAAIVWLAKQQGYNKRQFRSAMNKGDMSKPHGFLESMRVELANLPSHMSTLTFLVEMKLRDLIELNRLIRLQDRNGHFFDATKNPYCGYIVLGKETETGLFNPWDGGGSIFEIELEKDVRIPIRFIRSALPDVKRNHEYSVGDVYGMCRSAWRDTVKEIHAPKQFSDKR